jgi:two-component system sensor histidine kinase DesK
MKKRPKEGAPAPEANPVAEYLVTDSSTAIECDAAARGRRLPRGMRLLGPMFGLLWLAYPNYALLTSNPSPAQLAFALAGTALFAGIFLWLVWLHVPLRTATAEVSEVRKRRVAISSLAGLVVVLTLTCGNEWLTLFIHTSIAAGLMLPGRDARNIATIVELRAAREKIARLAVAEERLRFARDMHDLLGHSLSLITLKSELAGRLLPPIPEAKMALKEIHDVEGVARGALREVREAVAGYRRPTLDEELASAREMLEAAGISCRIENKAGVLPNGTDAVLAWTVREGVTNVIRHSRARRCDIRLTRNGEEIHAEISDDGRGSSPERNGEVTGSGLSGLAERVAASGGSVEAKTLPEGGFYLRVRLPLRDGAAFIAEQQSKIDGVREDRRR